MQFSALVLTLFPEMFPATLGHSLAGKALKEGIWSLNVLNIRDFATDKHKTVDGSPYGGGAGMVMRADVLGAAIDHAKTLLPNATLIYPSPRGVPMTQGFVQSLTQQPTTNNKQSNYPPPNLPPQAGGGIIVLCGRFEGIDQRVIDHYGLLEVSLGDFILSGGEIAALALLDAAVRLLPGVVGKEESVQNDSFSSFQRPVNRSFSEGGKLESQDIARDPCLRRDDKKTSGLLEYPHYTRPPDWNGRTVPDVLLSGDHKKIETWRYEQAKNITAARRPDLIEK